MIACGGCASPPMSLPAGNNTINASDVFSIFPSLSSNSTCLPGPQPSIFAIVGASVGGAVVLLALCLIILLILDRRRYRREVSQFNKSVSFNIDPYNEKRITPQVIHLSDSSTVSRPSPLQPSTITRSFTSRHIRPPSDISDDVLLPPVTINRSLSGRHLRAPSDVPADLNSRCSTVSTESYYPSMYETETKVPLPAVIAQSLGPRGLPASPRDGVTVGGNISRSTSRATSRAPSRATSKRSIT